MTSIASIAAVAWRVWLWLAKALRRPPRWVRALAVAGALILVLNVLWHGAQPYAVGLLPNGWDKVAHVALHFVLCTLLLFALGLRRGWWAVAACAAFSALDEYAQQFSPGRSVEFADWVASVAGALLGLAAAHAIEWQVEMRRLHRAFHMKQTMARWLRPPP